MKRYFAIALLLVVVVSAMAGCRSRNDMPATETPTTQASKPTMPDMEDMIPGPEDTIGENNGANQTEPTTTATETNGTTGTTENDNTRIRPRNKLNPGT